MLSTPTPRPARRMFAAVAVAAWVLVAGCSDDADDDEVPPANTSLDTLADEEVLDQAPGASNDVTDGAGEGGDRGSNAGSSGTAAP